MTGMARYEKTKRSVDRRECIPVRSRALRTAKRICVLSSVERAMHLVVYNVGGDTNGMFWTRTVRGGTERDRCVSFSTA